MGSVRLMGNIWSFEHVFHLKCLKLIFLFRELAKVIFPGFKFYNVKEDNLRSKVPVAHL